MKGWLQPLCVYRICVPPHTAPTVEVWPCSPAWQIRRGGSYRQTFDRLHLELSVIISPHISDAALEQVQQKVLFLQHQSVL